MNTVAVIEEQPKSSVITPIQLLGMAVQQGASIDQLERLMALKREYEKDQAKQMYNAAFAAFKAEAVVVLKNKAVKDGPLKGKSYAELHAVVDAVTPALSKHGLSASWKLTKDERDWLEVTCTLSHVGGHSEAVSMGSPPDTGGAKNAIQARASAVTYLERYTLKAILGIAEQDQDDDGEGTRSVMDGTRTRPDRATLRRFVNSIQAHIAADRPLGVLQEYDAAWDIGEEFCASVWNSLTTEQQDYISAAQDSRRKP